MAYIVNSKTESEGIQTGFMSVGIHENCELTSIRATKSPNGNNFIEFRFKNEAGEELAHTEWEPTGDDAAKLADKQDRQIKRLHQIVTKFISKEEYVVDAPDFYTFCLKTINLLGNRYVGKKVRIKVVYNNKNFTSLPSYAKYQFIESMDVPKDKSKIKVLALDKMLRSASNGPFETNNSDSHPFTETKPVINTNDLPF